MARKTQEKIYIYIIYIHSYIQECVRSLKLFKTKHAGLEKHREALPGHLFPQLAVAILLKANQNGIFLELTE